MSSETDWRGWAVRAFPVKTFMEDGLPDEEEWIAGWVRGPLALDYRPFHWDWWDRLPDAALPFAWAVTHVPSGWSLCAIAATASEARAFADRLAALTDWYLVTPANRHAIAPAVEALFAEYREILFDSTATMAPTAIRKEAA